MNRPVCLRVAMFGAFAAALLLSGCGRKGPLDPPPGGMALPTGGQTAVTNRGAASQPGVDAEGRPIAPAGRKRSIPADVLLD